MHPLSFKYMSNLCQKEAEKKYVDLKVLAYLKSLNSDVKIAIDCIEDYFEQRGEMIIFRCSLYLPAPSGAFFDFIISLHIFFTSLVHSLPLSVPLLASLILAKSSFTLSLPTCPRSLAVSFTFLLSTISEQNCLWPASQPCTWHSSLQYTWERHLPHLHGKRIWQIGVNSPVHFLC